MAVFWKVCLVVTLALCSQVSARNLNHLLGGWRDVDANDENIKSVLQFAKEEYNKQSKDGYIIKINKVIQSRQQVVAGMKYMFEVEALVYNGPVNESTMEECANITKKMCTFGVLTVPWRNNIKELQYGYCR
ncbi:hypothetical protein GDO78_021708 [Eleutherodactylus coqui]|uniref:Cystatin domain-containing protein n=1 Tax=Eleutherodactylus coqui TaxID=57060 RepID=A0A8J6EH67_ELECQ|nr:hypothetical protein GDO78_021708 [Eleutherodactylus coqui]